MPGIYVNSREEWPWYIVGATYAEVCAVIDSDEAIDREVATGRYVAGYRPPRAHCHAAFSPGPEGADALIVRASGGGSDSVIETLRHFGLDVYAVPCRRDNPNLPDPEALKALGLAVEVIESPIFPPREEVVIPRRMGRPRQHAPGSRRRVTLELPADLLAAVEASGATLTDYITAAIAERLEREQA